MKPKAGDVMFSREGGLLGIAVGVPPDLELCLGQRMTIFRVKDFVDLLYYLYYLNSEGFRSQYREKITGTASPHLNIGDIRQLVIPLASPAEQRRVVAAIDQLFEQANAIEQAVEAARRRVGKVDQAILARAFRGSCKSRLI